jgi:hypothetical protein
MDVAAVETGTSRTVMTAAFQWYNFLYDTVVFVDMAGSVYHLASLWYFWKISPNCGTRISLKQYGIYAYLSRVFRRRLHVHIPSTNK